MQTRFVYTLSDERHPDSCLGSVLCCFELRDVSKEGKSRKGSVQGEQCKLTGEERLQNGRLSAAGKRFVWGNR